MIRFKTQFVENSVLAICCVNLNKFSSIGGTNQCPRVKVIDFSFHFEQMILTLTTLTVTPVHYTKLILFVLFTSSGIRVTVTPRM